MTTIVFIHGTGVRRAAFDSTFGVVRQALVESFGVCSLTVEPCYWGDQCGSDLSHNGASIPGLAAPTAEPIDEDAALGLWATLYDNPAAELRLLAMRSPTADESPGRPPAGDDLNFRFKRLAPAFELLTPEQAERLRALLGAARLLDHVVPAQQDLIRRRSYREALEGAQAPLTEYRLALARALIAQSIVFSWETGAVAAGEVYFSRAGLEEAVELLVAAIGGKEAGVGAWLGGHGKRYFARLGTRVGTRWLRRERESVSRIAAPFGADVLVYQVRPRPLRDFIRGEIRRASRDAIERGESGRIVLLAHSLGGIAAFETLVEAREDAVAALVTVGSQVPLLYELGALGTLPPPEPGADGTSSGGSPLPNGFVPWLNIYDPDDFLSYCGEPIFGHRAVQDVEVSNGQPFPQSHSAYWGNPAVWAAVTRHVREATQ